MNATLSPAERKAQSRIWRTEDGGLAISEDFRAELARDFPLVPINETLRIVKTESGVKDTAVHLLSQVERKFAYAQRDESGRERRYAARTPMSPRRQVSSSSNELLQRPIGLPDVQWQNRLTQLVSDGRAARDQAIAAGWRPC
jgi:hypothetical protein